MFINGFPENWRDVLKEYFHVLKATNSLNTSHFSSFARRRSSSTVRGHSQSKITHRTSSLSTVLPEVIHEERHEEEESTIAERIQEEEDRIQDGVRSDGNLLIQNTITMDSGNHLMDKCAAESRPSSPERTRQSSAEPIIQSPVSISSQSNRRDCENEPIEVESYSDRGSSRPGCTRGESVSLNNSRAVVLAKLPFNINNSARQTNFKGQSDDAVELTGWSIRFTPAGCGGPPLGFPKFVLLGTRKNHPAQWQSSVVVRVESANIIHTSSTKYRLIGEMNIVDSAYAGFPKLFVSMFLQGFPPDWRTRITELYNDFFGYLNMPSGNEVGAIDSSRRRRLSKENEVTESRTFREVEEEPCIDDSLHRPERHAEDNALVPLHGQQSSADVRRSRSGRCLRPPLANWAGQRVRYDGARSGCNRLPRLVDDGERRYVDEREQQRRRIEVEWARENEQYSSASDQIDDDSYQEPVHKKRKKLQRKERVVYSTSEDSPSKSEDSENDSSEESIDKGKRRPELGEKREKGWSRAELDRLKLALKAIRVCNDDDWEKVARSLGNTRDRDSCKEAAIRRLKWEPPVNGVESPQVTSETVTARAGTIAYQHQANEYTRKFMMGGGVQGEDFFRNKDISLCESIPDVAEFGADDSLLEAIRTPVDAAAQRKRHDRYLHHLMNKGGLRNNDISRANYSRIANSTRNETMREGLLTKNANTFANLHQDLEGVAKMTRKASRRNTATEDSDMDLELDENYFDDMDDL
ncbi:unnamed protein product [Heligmosomoides polygyrus]|uniref:SANTA domain-containing protein n=1 Tax=Heligmosomoides polygyrus TaxID=6339 RepID=A0A3P8DUF3_HELPZ|nr:unnamed protein product [Heligmosomoides polygyrus]